MEEIKYSFASGCQLRVASRSADPDGHMYAASISVKSYVQQSWWFGESVSLISSIPLDLQPFPPPFPRVPWSQRGKISWRHPFYDWLFQGLSLIACFLDVSLCVYSHLLQEEASLIMAQRYWSVRSMKLAEYHYESFLLLLSFFFWFDTKYLPLPMIPTLVHRLCVGIRLMSACTMNCVTYCFE